MIVEEGSISVSRGTACTPRALAAGLEALGLAPVRASPSTA